MPEQPIDLTHELLRQIRTELTQIRTEQTSFRDAVEHRFDALETDMLEMKRTMRGITYMMATFTGRLEDLETRADRLTPG